MRHASIETALIDLQQIASQQLAHYTATGKMFSPQATCQRLHQIADTLHRMTLGMEPKQFGDVMGPDGITRHYKQEEEPG